MKVFVIYSWTLSTQFWINKTDSFTSLACMISNLAGSVVHIHSPPVKGHACLQVPHAGPISRFSICFLSDISLSVRRGEYVYSCGRESVIWDVQPLAVKTNISARVDQLAEPKKLPPEHEEQR